MITQRFDLRRVQRIALGVFASAAFVLAAVGVLGGGEQWFGPALVFGLAAMGPAVVLLTGVHPAPAAVWIALVLTVGQLTIGIPETEIPAGIALVAIGVVLLGGFVPRRLQYPTAGLWALALALVPLWWSGADALPLGLGLSAGFLLLFWVNLEIADVQRRLREERTRFLEVLDRSGAPILELDFDPIAGDLRRLGGSEADLEQLLIEDRDLLDELFGRVTATAMNDAARTELRAEDLSLPVAPSSDGVNPENVEAAAEWLAALADGASTWEGTLRVGAVDDTHRWYACRHIVPESTGLRQTYLTLVDISQTIALQEKLDMAQREFIATISHELRTPLSAVVGFSAELAEHLGDYDPETMTEMLGLIHRQSRELSYIVDDLVAASGSDIGSMKVVPEPFDVREAVEQVLEVTGVDLPLEGEAAHAGYADPIRFAQIVRNLVTNVERYGGDRARVELRDTGASVAVDVVDDGPGIPSEKIEQIFGRNGKVTSSEVIGSMGLGLHVSRSLAEMMGSSLTYERTDDESRFRIEVPAAPGG